MSERLGAADPRLNDPVWMRRMYAQHGDMWIALETGAARETVRKRREYLGVESLRPGRRRITIAPSVGQYPSLDDVSRAVVTRIHRERQRKAAPTEDRLVASIRAAHEARAAGEELAYDDALLGIASAAALVLEHRQKLRRVA